MAARPAKARRGAAKVAARPVHVPARPANAPALTAGPRSVNLELTMRQSSTYG